MNPGNAGRWNAGSLPACQPLCLQTRANQLQPQSVLFCAAPHARRQAAGVPSGVPTYSEASLINSGINTASGSVGQCLTGNSRFIVFVFNRNGLKIDR